MKETLASAISSATHIRAGVEIYSGSTITSYLTLDAGGYLLQEDGTSKFSRDGSSKIIYFTSALPSSSYVLTINCYNSSNESVGYIVTDRTSSSFTITPLEAVTIEYSAIYTQ